MQNDKPYMKMITTIAGLMKRYPLFKAYNNMLYFEDKTIASGCLRVHLEDNDFLCVHTDEGSWKLFLDRAGISGVFYYNFTINPESLYPFFDLNIEVVNNKMDMVVVHRTWYINSLKNDF